MPRRLLLPVDGLPGFTKLDSCQIHEFQLYAVEKWLVDRARFLSLLVVYTGHPEHSVLLNVFETDDNVVFDSIIAALRADGAKAKQTEHGTLMVTSLAHFRSDYTIVLIPQGRFLTDVRDRLYANIDLLRIGASGRTALTLEDPSETTKERFTSTYHIPAGDIHIVLRLVSLIQAALAIFGFYPHPSMDGLLCNDTLNAIRKWTASIGSPYLSLNPPTDKSPLDPCFVAALFSFVLSSRNKLALLGYSVPADPFINPTAFSPILSREILDAISAAYESSKQKPDKHLFVTPTTDLSFFVSQILSPPSHHHHPGGQKKQGRERSLSLRVNVNAITDATSPVDHHAHLSSLASLRALWAPHLSSLVLPHPKRSRASRVQNSRGGVASDGDGAEDPLSSWRRVGGPSKPRRHFDGGRSTEEESDVARHSFRWKGKLGSWAGLSKRKHQSVDLSATSSFTSSLRGTVPVRPPIPPPKDKGKSPFFPQSQSQPQSRSNTLGHESAQSLSTTHLSIPARSQSYNASTSITSSPKLDTPRRRGHPSRRSTIGTVAEKAAAGVKPNANDRKNARAQSPTLPPMGFFGEPEDDDLLSSGQVSPLSDAQTRPNPFHIYYQSAMQMQGQGQALAATSSHLQPTRPPLSSRQSSNATTSLNQPNLSPNPNHDSATTPITMIDEKILSKLLLDSKKKPKMRRGYPSQFGPQARIASWAGPDGGGAWGEEAGLEGDIENEELEEQESDTSCMYRSRTSAAAAPALPTKGVLRSEVIQGTAAAAAEGMSAAVTGTTATQASPSTWLRKKEKARFHSLLSVVDVDGQLYEEVALSGGGIGTGSLGSEDGERMWEREDERRVYRDEGEEEADEEEYDEEEEEMMEALRRRTRWFEPRRRRSFHDLDTFREVEVLSPERMKIDVELCGQCLIMWRREKHLQNVLNCVHHISTSLRASNTALRTHFSKHHRPAHLSSLTSQSSLLLLPLPATDELAHKTERYQQGTNVLLYETEQFGVKELWAAASAMRRKVWELREDVFGAGAGAASEAQQRQRKHPSGVHGAYGAFNRLQWRLDGRSVLVDQFGRTESEAEEEGLLDSELEVGGAGGGGADFAASSSVVEPESALPSSAAARNIEGDAGHVHANTNGGLKETLAEEEDSEDVVEHPGIKPVWLLRFFTSWRARWSAVSSSPSTQARVVGLDAAPEVTEDAGALIGDSSPPLNNTTLDDANANPEHRNDVL